MTGVEHELLETLIAQLKEQGLERSNARFRRQKLFSLLHVKIHYSSTTLSIDSSYVGPFGNKTGCRSG